MLSIRLARIGKKKQPSYRIIVCQKHKDPHGDYIDNIGHINYFGNEKTVVIDKEKAEKWLKDGAQPTDTVHNIFVSEGLINEKKVKPHGVRVKKKGKKDEEVKEGGAKEEKPAEGAKEEKAKDTKEETKEEKPAEEPKEEKKEDEKPEEKKED